VRPGFSSVEEMDDSMVERWNSVVKQQDKVYHLGDVAMSKHHIAIIGRCNGRKRLVLGNHDTHPIKLYLPFFEDIYSGRLLDRMMLTHIPVHPESIGKSIANIHGHIHNSFGPLCYGPRYYNVSTEVLDYTPIALEDLKKRVLAQQR
jgi:calcineurin-like phosphoesterase family protein